jgi:uncharacterized sulfatase
MMAHRDHPLFARSFGLQPEELLFDVEADPGCLRNLAGEPGYAKRRKELRTTLERELKRQGDPRLLGQGDLWESYPRYSPMRKILGGFAEEGKYNPSYSGRQ